MAAADLSKDVQEANAAVVTLAEIVVVVLPEVVAQASPLQLEDSSQSSTISSELAFRIKVIIPRCDWLCVDVPYSRHLESSLSIRGLCIVFGAASGSISIFYLERERKSFLAFCAPGWLESLSLHVHIADRSL